jgi:hypothetical protein
MWPVIFEDRLREWRQLRDNIAAAPVDAGLMTINDWWFKAPMVNRHLSWSNCHEWPGPWDLLAEDTWCDLARALGMLYTITMHPQNQFTVSLAQTSLGNLVLVEHGKYILNWAPGQILNRQSINFDISREIDGSQFSNLG